MCSDSLFAPHLDLVVCVCAMAGGRWDSAKPNDPWWLPCPKTCDYNAGGVCWCDSQSDRLSASLVHRNSPPTREQSIPVYSLKDSRGVGIVLAPSLAGVLCS